MFHFRVFIGVYMKSMCFIYLRKLFINTNYFNILSLKKKFDQQNDPTFLFSFLSGAISGSISATMTLPFDVVKTHRQIEVGEKLVDSSTNQHKVIEIMKNIYSKNGIRGLFAGLAPRLYKVSYCLIEY